MFIWLNTVRSNFYRVLPGLYRASRSLRKGRSNVPPSTDFETMTSLPLHDAGVVYFTEYLSVLFQLTYLDELYGECNGTARACANSRYRALFSPITERLGTRLRSGNLTCCRYSGRLALLRIYSSNATKLVRYSLVPRPTRKTRKWAIAKERPEVSLEG